MSSVNLDSTEQRFELILCTVRLFAVRDKD